MTLEELLQALPGPLAVVGNGPLGQFGPQIDSAGSVLRFNNYVLQPSKTGIRTDVWVVNGWDDVDGRPGEARWVASPFHATDDAGRVVRWAERWGHRVILPSAKLADEVRAFKAKPSTGLLLLHAVSELGVPALAYGFGGMVGGHYWDAAHEHDHPPEFSAYASLSGIGFVR